jgi:hypothetical protein
MPNLEVDKWYKVFKLEDKHSNKMEMIYYGQFKGEKRGGPSHDPYRVYEFENEFENIKSKHFEKSDDSLVYVPVKTIKNKQSKGTSSSNNLEDPKPPHSKTYSKGGSRRRRLTRKTRKLHRKD